MTATRLGVRSAATTVIIGLAYVAVLAAGFARHGLDEPITDPILAIMELLTFASALPLLAVFVAIHALAEPGRRLAATLTLCFGAMFSFATMAVHLVELTAGRQLGGRGLVWPSTTYAVELLAWDFLLGAALVLAADAIGADEGTRGLRRWMRVTGALCIAGLIGPAVGDMRLQLIGVFGYAVLLPVVAWQLARWFRAEDARSRSGAA